jgi:hypothetical protein
VLTVRPGQSGDSPGHPAVEIAIYPNVVWLAERSLRGRRAEPGLEQQPNGQWR